MVGYFLSSYSPHGVGRGSGVPSPDHQQQGEVDCVVEVGLRGRLARRDGECLGPMPSRQCSVRRSCAGSRKRHNKHDQAPNVPDPRPTQAGRQVSTEFETLRLLLTSTRHFGARSVADADAKADADVDASTLIHFPSALRPPFFVLRPRSSRHFGSGESRRPSGRASRA